VKSSPGRDGPEVAKAVAAQKEGDVLMLENVRLRAEQIKDKKAKDDPALRRRRKSSPGNWLDGDVY